MKPDTQTITLIREILAVPAPTGTKDTIAAIVSAAWPELKVEADPDYWKRPEGGRKWFVEEPLPEAVK